MTGTQWSIQDIARAAGTTSRTLRHYGQVGLLEPSRVGANGYRYYDEQALVRLQRILLLRDLGLSLPSIGEVLDGEQDSAAALRAHLEWLEQERGRIGRQIESVRATLRKLEGGEQLMANEMFDGFDHTQYEQEVTERWGKEAYDRSNNWWNALTEPQRKAFMQEQADIARDFGAARAAGLAAESDEVQAITARQYTWLGHSSEQVSKAYFTGLGDMYVADDRFTANYDKHGEGTAVLIRDAMHVYAERNL